MRELRLGVHAAITHVKRARFIISPNPGFMRQLHLFEQQQFAPSSSLTTEEFIMRLAGLPSCVVCQRVSGSRTGDDDPVDIVGGDGGAGADDVQAPRPKVILLPLYADGSNLRSDDSSEGNLNSQHKLLFDDNSADVEQKDIGRSRMAKTVHERTDDDDGEREKGVDEGAFAERKRRRSTEVAPEHELKRDD
eukprot:Opistho-2@93429